MIGGAGGLITGAILLPVILLPIYEKVGQCASGANGCADDLTVEEIGVKLASILIYVSLGAVISGLIMMITTTVKSKH